MGQVTGLQTRILIGILLVGMATHRKAQAQDWTKHRWEDRVIVLLAPGPDHPELARQLRALRDAEAALSERAGVVYRVYPDRFVRGLHNQNPEDREPGPVFGMSPQSGFALLLLGLDGGVKLRSGSFVAPEEIWSRIDAMPMRRAEMKNKGTD